MKKKFLLLSLFLTSINAYSYLITDYTPDKLGPSGTKISKAFSVGLLNVQRSDGTTNSCTGMLIDYSDDVIRRDTSRLPSRVLTDADCLMKSHDPNSIGSIERIEFTPAYHIDMGYMGNIWSAPFGYASATARDIKTFTLTNEAKKTKVSLAIIRLDRNFVDENFLSTLENKEQFMKYNLKKWAIEDGLIGSAYPEKNMPLFEKSESYRRGFRAIGYMWDKRGYRFTSAISYAPLKIAEKKYSKKVKETFRGSPVFNRYHYNTQRTARVTTNASGIIATHFKTDNHGEPWIDTWIFHNRDDNQVINNTINE